MKIADLGQLGYLPLQCFDTRYALEVRPAVFATRIDRRWSDTLGRYVQEAASSGDVLCSFLWKTAGGGGVGVPGGIATGTGGSAGGGGGLAARKIPGWAFGWPAVVTADGPDAPKGDDDVNVYATGGTQSQPGGSPNFGGGFSGIPQTTSGPKPGGGGGAATVLPVYDSQWTPDTRFASKDIATPPKFPALTKGTVGLAFAGTRELSQEEVFFPIGGDAQLIATHWAGDFWRSTHVYDLTAEGKLDQVLKAKLHQLLRVYEIPKHCGAPSNAVVGGLGRPGNHSLSLQMGTARGGLPGNLLITDDRALGSPAPEIQDHGVATWRLSGPLTVGSCAKHLYWPDDQAGTKKERFRPLHLSTGAYWEAFHFGCGPLEFTRQPYPRDAIDNGVPTRVYLSYDQVQPHDFYCGQREGMWRWWTTTPIYKPVPHDGGRSVPGKEEGFNTIPGLAPDPFPTQPGDNGDEPGRTTPSSDPDRSNPRDETGIDTKPVDDQHFTTDPAKEAFQSSPGTLADPGPNASHQVRDIGIGGLTTPETDPWDGPANTTHTSIGGGGSQPGSQPGRAPNATPFGLSFLEDVGPIDGPAQTVGASPAPLPPRRFDASQTARALGGVGLGMLAVAQAIAFSEIVLRAPQLAPDVPNYTNTFGALKPSDTSYIDGSSSIVGSFAPFAQARGGQSVVNSAFGQARYGNESSGGLVFTNPGIGLEQIFDGKSPTSSSTTTLVMYSGANARTYLSFGSPNFQTGQINTGYRISLSADGTKLTYDHANGTGVFDGTIPLIIDSGAQTVTAFGTVLGGGGGSTTWDRVATTLQPHTGTDIVNTGTGGLNVLGGGLVVSAGGATITLGGLTVSAGGAAITGNTSVTSGTISDTGGQTNSEIFGATSSVAGQRSSAFGKSATASSADGTALGYNTSVGNSSTAVGASASATSTDSVALGHSAGASGSSSTSVGANSSAAQNSVAVGQGAFATGVKCVAVGLGALTGFDGGVAIGGGARANNTQAIAIGDPTIAAGVNSIAIGTAGTTVTPDRSIGIGKGALVGDVDTIVIGGKAGGSFAASGGLQSVAIGHGSSAGSSSIPLNAAFGYQASAGGSAGNSTAVGANSSCVGTGNNVAVGTTSIANSNSIALGNATVANTVNALVAGSTTSPINSVFFGQGDGALATPTAFTIKNTPASGTDVAGAAIKIETGLATGAGASGRWSVLIGQPGVSSSTLQTSSEVLGVFAAGVAVTGTLTSTGYHGVGTSSPQYPLDVVGDAQVSGLLRAPNGIDLGAAGLLRVGALAVANAPVNPTTPALWVAVILPDQSTGYVPVYV